MQTTPNMGLTAWDLTSDPYSHAQLSANFNAIDIHNHTASHGVQVPTGGLADGSVTTVKLADGAVTTVKIGDGQVTKIKLAPDALFEKVGDVKMIWTPNPGTYVPPTTWVVMMGQTLIAGSHDFAGGGSITLPDARNCFPLGADLTGTGTGTGTPPAVGGAGGSHNANLAHTHTVSPHSHSVNAHSHSISADGGHQHSISADGSHAHGWIGNVLQQRTTGVGSASGSRQTLFVPGLNAGGVIDNQVDAPMDSAGSHSHGGLTGNAGVHTHGGATGSISPGTDAQSPGTSSALGSVDTRPKFVGLLFIIKVLN